MAIINSYPLATPKLTDLVLGTSTSSTGQTSTKSFTVQSIKDTTAAVQTIITTIPATLNITGSGTANVTINAVTAAITSGGAALATGGDIYTFLTGKITGTPNTLPIWTDATTLGDSLISQANNGVIINGNSTDGKLTLNCSATTHGVTLQSPPHSASATYTWILPQAAGTAGQVLTSGGGATDQLTWSTNGNVGGTGTANKLSKWTGANTLADSNIEDTGSLVTISSATKVTGNLELDADLLDVNGGTGTAGQLLSSLGTGNGIDWVDAPVTGVVTVTSADANVITVGGTSTNPTIDANTGAVSSSSDNLATGTQIQAAIDLALAGAITFKGTFNANTGQITGGSDYLYNPGANTNTIAVAVGDMYVVSVAGNFFGNSSTALNVGDEVIAVTQSTISPSNSQESYYNAVPSAGGGITGGGTTNKVPLWTGTTVLGNSEIAQSSSNIGIGTTSPANGKLQIDSATNQISIETGTSGDGRLQIGHFSNGAFIGTYGDDGGVGDVIRFGTHSGDERMRIDSSGNVGIGTSSPSAPLFFGKAVYGAPSSEDFYRIKFNDLGGVNNDVGVGQPDANSLGFNVEPAGAITFNRGTGGETMRIDSTGNVGIGTTSPSVSLDINDTDAIQVPAGTTAQRPTPANGMLRYSTTDNQFEGYADGAWGAIAGGGGLPTKTVNQITVANATTGTITLSVSPTNENYTDMYVSGVYQNKSTYTLSGSTITLDGGAYFPNGAIVEVVSTT